MNKEKKCSEKSVWYILIIILIIVFLILMHLASKERKQAVLNQKETIINIINGEEVVFDGNISDYHSVIKTLKRYKKINKEQAEKAYSAKVYIKVP